MDRIKESMQELKEKIYDMYGEEKNDDDFAKLVGMSKTIQDPELFETLILMHSNYRSEMQQIKAQNIRILITILDNHTRHIDHIETHIEDKTNSKEPKKKGIFSPINILIVISIILTIVIGVVIVFSFYSKDHEAAKLVNELFMHMISAATNSKE
jgi:hypothetical protein